MSLPEETGKTISNVADAMKTSPACLALVLLVTVIAGLSTWNNHNRNIQQHDELMTVIKTCGPKGNAP